MNDVLHSLNEISGVIGSAVFDAQNQCLAHLAPPPFEPILLSQVMGEMRSALDYLNYLDDASPWEMFSVSYEGGYVILRKVDELTILTLAQPTLNAAMLGIGLNVASLKLQKRPAQPSGQQFSQSGGSPQFNQTGGHAPVSNPNFVSTSGRASMSGTNSGPSLSLSDSAGGAGPAPPNAVGHEVMNQLVKCLAKQVGPFAKVVLKEELSKLGVTAHTIVRGQFEDLVLMLLSRIPDPVKRREFLEAVGKIPNR